MPRKIGRERRPLSDARAADKNDATFLRRMLAIRLLKGGDLLFPFRGRIGRGLGLESRRKGNDEGKGDDEGEKWGAHARKIETARRKKASDSLTARSPHTGR